jgi:hypothetical protein
VYETGGTAVAMAWRYMLGYQMSDIRCQRSDARGRSQSSDVRYQREKPEARAQKSDLSGIGEHWFSDEIDEK